jgi:uncharacterized protein involved in exopolysaccharide biosynthesis
MTKSSEEKQTIKANDSQDVDLQKLVKSFLDGRKTVYAFIIAGFITGLAISLVLPKEYTSKTSVVPQTAASANKLGGLSSLAAMAGFNLDLNAGTDQLTPLLYPDIVKSVPFQVEIMYTPFTFSGIDQPVSIYDYYTNIKKPGFMRVVADYTIGLPSKIGSAISKKKPGSETGTSPIKLTKNQEKIRKMIDRKVTLNIDAKTGLLTLKASFGEPLLSAQVAEKTRDLLQEYVTRFKIEKAAGQLAFIEERYEEKMREFRDIQGQLALFRDQNKNVSSAVAKTQEERLQSEYSIALSVCNELAKQLEKAKIQVKEETPVFTILEPARVPAEKSKPKILLTLIISVFLGAFLGLCTVFLKTLVNDVKAKWSASLP